MLGCFPGVRLTFAPLAAGLGLFHHQSAVLRHRRTFLLLTVGLPLLHTGKGGGGG